MAIGTVESIGLGDAASWRSLAQEAGADDVYFQPEYVSPFVANGDGSAQLFVYRDQTGTALFPGLLRPVEIGGQPTGYFDLISPYGYSGPVIQSQCPEQLVTSFCSAWRQYCREHSIVSEFVRFHPLLHNAESLMPFVTVEAVRSTVHIDLRSGIESIWTDSFSGRARTAVRKAQKLGVQVVFGQEPESLNRFSALYRSTMERLGAGAYYRFSPGFYDALLGTVMTYGTFAEAWYGGVPIASMVLLKGDRFLHYHLSGSDPSFRDVPATSLLLHEATAWGCSQGLESFHLGGGYSGDDDSLFRFKESFSSLRSTYHVGKIIHIPDVYEKLVSLRFSDRRLVVPTGHFPQYRQP